MSITFLSNADCPRIVVREGCLCAQMAPGFLSAPAQVLAAHADPGCLWCAGTGLDERQEPADPQLNVTNVNAHALLAFLRLIDDSAYLHGRIPTLRSVVVLGDASSPYELAGEAALPIMRRALLRARNTFDRRAPYFVRELEVLRGTRPGPGGTTALCERVVSGGLSAERLAQYLTALEALCAFAEQQRATLIVWG